LLVCGYGMDISWQCVDLPFLGISYYYYSDSIRVRSTSLFYIIKRSRQMLLLIRQGFVKFRLKKIHKKLCIRVRTKTGKYQIKKKFIILVLPKVLQKPDIKWNHSFYLKVSTLNPFLTKLKSSASRMPRKLDGRIGHASPHGVGLWTNILFIFIRWL
jgi:hypothetical protein